MLPASAATVPGYRPLEDPRMTGHHVRANFDNMILDLDARNRTRRVHGTVAAAVDDHAPAPTSSLRGPPSHGIRQYR
jgi:hypothetical protein